MRKKHKNRTKFDASGHICNEVDRLNPQISLKKRGKYFNLRQVLAIVRKLTWAKNSKKRDLSEHLNFSDLYSELSSALLFWEESIRKQGIGLATADDRILKPQAIPKINLIEKYSTPAFKRSPCSRRLQYPRSFRQQGQRDLSEVTGYRCHEKVHYAPCCKNSRRLIIQETVYAQDKRFSRASSD